MDVISKAQDIVNKLLRKTTNPVPIILGITNHSYCERLF